MSYKQIQSGRECNPPLVLHICSCLVQADVHPESSSPMASYYSQLPLQSLQDEAKTQTPHDGLSKTCPILVIRSASLRTLYMQTSFSRVANEGARDLCTPLIGHGTSRHAPPSDSHAPQNQLLTIFVCRRDPWIPAQIAVSTSRPAERHHPFYCHSHLRLQDLLRFHSFILLSDWLHLPCFHLRGTLCIFTHIATERYLFSSIKRMSPGGSWTVSLDDHVE